MKRTVLVGFAAAVVLGFPSARSDTHSPNAPNSTTCPVTWPQGGSYGNESLRVVLPPGGKFVFRPGGPGFVDHDGALGIKVPWERGVKGQLFVGGRRLDGAAAPARAYLHDYGDTGFQASYLVFPTPGCWQISAGVGNTESLTFVVVVEKIAAGPSWRFEGLSPGQRVTTGSPQA